MAAPHSQSSAFSKANWVPQGGGQLMVAPPKPASSESAPHRTSKSSGSTIKYGRVFTPKGRVLRTLAWVCLVVLGNRSWGQSLTDLRLATGKARNRVATGHAHAKIAVRAYGIDAIGVPIVDPAAGAQLVYDGEEWAYSGSKWYRSFLDADGLIRSSWDGSRLTVRTDPRIHAATAAKGIIHQFGGNGLDPTSPLGLAYMLRLPTPSPARYKYLWLSEFLDEARPDVSHDGSLIRLAWSGPGLRGLTRLIARLDPAHDYMIREESLSCPDAGWSEDVRASQVSGISGIWLPSELIMERALRGKGSQTSKTGCTMSLAYDPSPVPSSLFTIKPSAGDRLYVPQGVYAVLASGALKREVPAEVADIAVRESEPPSPRAAPILPAWGTAELAGAIGVIIAALVLIGRRPKRTS